MEAPGKHSVIVPEPLEKGGKISIVSPSGWIDPSIIDRAAAMLEAEGYEVETGQHAKARYGRFAGKRHERLADLQRAFDDSETRVVLCSRGGYGAVQLAGSIDMKGFMRSPKWVAGFSDITAIHALLQSHGIASLHAPMLKHIVENGMQDESVKALFDIMHGAPFKVSAPSHRLDRPGKARGKLRGGNLSVLSGLRGTPLDFDAEGTILFIEDIDELPYRIDRMMWNLKLGGIIDRLAGLVVGQFTGHDDDCSMQASTYELIARMAEEVGCPACFNFPVGHSGSNVPIVCGIDAVLDINSNGTTLRA